MCLELLRLLKALPHILLRIEIFNTVAIEGL
jgi:hypothetical protein